MLSIFDTFEYDVSSPTLLRLKVDNYSIKSGITYGVIGQAIGNFQKRADGSKKCVSFRFRGVKYLAHNIIYELHYNVKPSGIIDHIDGNPWNNLISNLRIADSTTNARNVAKSSRNKSGTVGVALVTASNCKYSYYEAYVKSLDKSKLIRKKFSINELGIQIALQSAIEWRKQQIEQLNKSGAGYTNRHGL